MTTISQTRNTDPLLSPQEAATYLNRDARTMANDRSQGLGPNFARLGRLVRYRKSDLDAYIEQSLVSGDAA